MFGNLEEVLDQFSLGKQDMSIMKLDGQQYLNFPNFWTELKKKTQNVSGWKGTIAPLGHCKCSTSYATP